VPAPSGIQKRPISFREEQTRLRGDMRIVFQVCQKRYSLVFLPLDGKLSRWANSRWPFDGEMQMGHYIWAKEAVGVIPGNQRSSENIYMLFTKGCENNVFPHTMTWSPQYIGIYEEIVDHAFLLASSAEDGMIRSAKDSILPETLIARILKCLEFPFQIPCQNIRVEKGDSFYSSITPTHCAEIYRRLREQGQGCLVDVLEKQGAIELNIWNDALAIIALARSGVLLWTMFHIDPENHFQEPSYGRKYATKPGRVSEIGVFRLSQRDLVVACFEGKWRAYWTCEAVKHFIITVARLHEHIYPRSFKEAILKFRQQCQTAPVLGDDVELHINPDAGNGFWLRENMREIIEAFGETGAFTTTLGDLRAKGQLHRLKDIGECQEWLLPKPELWREQSLLGLS
jgi:hypothetical protein